MSVDYTTYTEVDTEGNLVVDSATQITATTVERNDTSYVYKDYSADAFADFTVTGNFNAGTHSNGGLLAVFALSNTVGVLSAQKADDVVFLYTLKASNGQYLLTLQQYASGAQLDADSTGTAATEGTDYWFTVTRVGTTITAVIYTDVDKTSILDTLTITGNNTAYRYHYPVCSEGDSGTLLVSAVIGPSDHGLAGITSLTTADMTLSHFNSPVMNINLLAPGAEMEMTINASVADMTLLASATGEKYIVSVPMALSLTTGTIFEAPSISSVMDVNLNAPTIEIENTFNADAAPINLNVNGFHNTFDFTTVGHVIATTSGSANADTINQVYTTPNIKNPQMVRVQVRKPYRNHYSYLDMTRTNSTRPYGGHSEGKKPYLLGAGQDYLDMEDLDDENFVLSDPTGRPPSAPPEGQPVEEDPCGGSRSLWAYGVPSTIECGQSTSNFVINISPDFISPKTVLLSPEDTPNIGVDPDGNILMDFECGTDGGIVTFAISDELCGGFTTVDFFIESCEVDCSGTSAVAGPSAILPTTTGQYTLIDARGKVTWSVSGSGLSIDQDGLVTAESDACGSGNVYAQDKCCGGLSKDVTTVNCGTFAVSGPETIQYGGGYGYQYTASGGSGQAVEWSVAGVGASIDQNGLMTVDGGQCGKYVITATDDCCGGGSAEAYAPADGQYCLVSDVNYGSSGVYGSPFWDQNCICGTTIANASCSDDGFPIKKDYTYSWAYWAGGGSTKVCDLSFVPCAGTHPCPDNCGSNVGNIKCVTNVKTYEWECSC